jgi:hypothetical protein
VPFLDTGLDFLIAYAPVLFCRLVTLPRFPLSALVILCLVLNGCAVTGPRVTSEEEAAGRGHIRRADYVTWWSNQKRLLRVSDRFAWNVQAPDAPYKNAFGVWPVLRRRAGTEEIALFTALGNPPDGTVLHVSTGSPGERAELAEGDLVVSINGRAISTVTKEDMAKLAATGQPQTFSVRKRGEDNLTSLTITPARVLDITFYAFASDVINAAAGPVDGINLVRVNYGMLKLVRSDDELAAVLGHEIVHILKSHVEKSATIRGIGALIATGVIVAGAARGVNVTDAVDGIRGLTTITDRGFSRDYEREADYLGLYLADQAGFDINAALSYWEHIGAVAPQLSANYLSTHPSTPERFVRIQKTIDEIEHGGLLEAAWRGDPVTQTGIARIRQPADTVKSTAMVSAGSSVQPHPSTVTSTTVSKVNVPKAPSSPPSAVAALPASPAVIAEPRSPTKIYASLVQYDGPKVKSGITLDAQFLDDGSGTGETIVSDIRNSSLRGTFKTVLPGAQERPTPKILDRATLNKLQMAADKPWVIATLSNADTLLECVYGDTPSFGQKKGACRDNWGNRYWLYVNP